MEYWIQTSTLYEHEYNEKELPLGLSDAFWNELATCCIFHHYEYNNIIWEIINWCFDNNITFTIRSYSYNDYDICENKKDFDKAWNDIIFYPPCVQMDMIQFFINIPNNDQAILFKLIWR